MTSNRSSPLHPILTCSAAKAFEDAFFGDDLARAESAMRRAGMTVGRAILADLPKSFFEHPFPTHLIVLCGKGNNTGDALYAAYAIALEQNVAHS